MPLAHLSVQRFCLFNQPLLRHNSLQLAKRKEEFGELLWLDKITAAHLRSLQVSLGTYCYAESTNRGQHRSRAAS